MGESREPSLKATLRFGAGVDPAFAGLTSVVSTLGGVAPSAPEPLDLDETIDASTLGTSEAPVPSPAQTSAARTTVLPRRRTYEALAWVDRHPVPYVVVFYGLILCLLGGLGFGAYRLVRWL